MAVSKVILNGNTLIDTTNKTVTSASMLSGITALKNDGTTATGSIASQAAQIIHPSTSDQTIASGKYLSGTQTIKAVTTTNLTAANIADGVTVKIGDSTDDDCVASITGTHQGGSTAIIQDTLDAAGGTIRTITTDQQILLTSLSATSNTTYNAPSGTAYNEVVVNVGSTGAYAWLGPGTVKDFTKTITLNLASDTTWSSWTASTTASTICYSPSDADFSYSYNFKDYAIWFITTAVTNYVYTSGATKIALPISNGRTDVLCYYGGHNSWSTYQSRTIDTSMNTASINYTHLYYYSTSGAQLVAVNNYGIYPIGVPSINMSTPSNDSLTLSYYRAGINARCSSSYFATARKDDIDAEKTNIVITVDVYKTPMSNCSHFLVHDNLIALMNAAPENQ